MRKAGIPSRGRVRRSGVHASPVLNPSVTRGDDGGWVFTWIKGFPPYRVYLDGVLLDTVTTETFESLLPGYEDRPPAIEVVNLGDPSGNVSFPPYVLLQWRGLQTAIGYVVEQLVGIEWVPVGSMLESARGYYSWQSQTLPDDTTNAYRVHAVDVAGNAGVPLPFTITVCRNPEDPNPTIEVSTSGNVVVS